MKKREIIKKTEAFVQKKMKGDPGHDWSHVNRVRKIALRIGRKEKADLFVVELAALLHDVADYKFYNWDDKIALNITRNWLWKMKVSPATIDHVCDILDEVAFKGAGVKYNMKTIEGKVVQDADKLDALGAIGIARTFSYGGHFNLPMYVPGKNPEYHKSFAQYKKHSVSTINHFYEKLLLLKDRMHTKTAKKLATSRHEFMVKFLKQFYEEWGTKS